MLGTITYLLPAVIASITLGLFVLKPFAEVYKNGLISLISTVLFQLFFLVMIYNGRFEVEADLLVLQFLLIAEFSILLVWLIMRLQVIAITEFNLFRVAMLLGILTQWYVSLQIFNE